MVESDLRLIDPATFGLDEGNIFKDEGVCVPHHQHFADVELCKGRGFTDKYVLFVCGHLFMRRFM